MIAFSSVILVKLNLKAVATAAHSRHRRKRSIPFSADRDIPDRFVVNDDGTDRVFLTRRRFQKFVPVIDHNIDRMDFGSVKQRIFIAHNTLCILHAKRGCIHKQNRYQQ